MLRFASAVAAFLFSVNAAAVSLAVAPLLADDHALLLPVGAQGLSCLGYNDASGAACAEGLAGFAVSLSVSGRYATWTLTNLNAQATATRVYLELSDDAELTRLDAVDAIFKSNKKIKDLPGGKAADFEAEWYFEAVSPGPKNGLNPGDSLSLTFRLDGDDLWTAERLGRLGFHVQSFEGGFSESFVTTGPALTPVPLPGTQSLLGLGVLGLGLVSLRRKS